MALLVLNDMGLFVSKMSIELGFQRFLKQVGSLIRLVRLYVSQNSVISVFVTSELKSPIINILSYLPM